MFRKLRNFLKESREELRHVNWPARNEAIRLTTVVVGISMGLAVFLGAFDYGFTTVIKTLIAR
ncbi:MAG: preprotein translocase subunit SecE [Candidatus Liptonbacteria bacterium]|nr:preprotein translocase subunit SecE [Candidatus Liptonbacteria bacterium]